MPKLWKLNSWNLKKFLPLNMCHMSGVRFQVSGVRCHVSCVICNFVFLQSAGASRWRICYQLCLPRLVSLFLPFLVTRPDVARAVLKTALLLTDSVLPGLYYKQYCYWLINLEWSSSVVAKAPSSPYCKK